MAFCSSQGSPRGVVANVPNCDIVISDFELISHYYSLFWTNTHEKGLNLQISSSYQYRTLALRLECSPIARETWVQSQVESYQRLKKWYLMPPCLTLSIIRYGSRVKWSNPGKGVPPSPTPWCSKLSKREPSGHPRLWSPTLLFYVLNSVTMIKRKSDLSNKIKFDFFLSSCGCVNNTV